MNYQSKRSRKYSTGTMAAVNHPLRVNIIDLLQKGINTTPALAECLNENRINLYHHLQILEQAGLIESYYKGDRVKKFRLKIINTEKQMLSIHENPSIANIIVLSSDVKNKNKFDKKVKELFDIANAKFDKNAEILMVQIVLQDKRQAKSTSDKVKKIMKQQKY